MSLRDTLGRFAFKSYKNQMGDDVIVMSLKFSPNYCHNISISIEHKNFILGTNIQKHWVHLILRVASDLDRC